MSASSFPSWFRRPLRRVSRFDRRPASLAVVIPAHDEAQLIGAWLLSVRSALEVAGLPSVVVVVAHRCTDETAAEARRVLGRTGLLVVDGSSRHVSEVRRRGAGIALEHLAPEVASRSWLLSTDADTVVPRDWVRQLFTEVGPETVAVAGLAELDSRAGLPPAGRVAYEKIVADGIRGETHDHAYAANLAVRVDAYLEIGGWPPVVHGEEHALLAALEAAGKTVLRTTGVVVTTSARQDARANGGLGDLLRTLATSDFEPDTGAFRFMD